MTAWSIQNNSWIVLGCPAEEDVDQKFGEQAEVAVDDDMVSHLGSSERSYASLGTKRHLSPDIERNGTLVKRQKCETSPPSWECPPDPSKPEASTSCSRPSPNPVAQALVQRRKIRGSLTEASVEPMEDLGECDLFLSEGFRLRWCRCSTVSAFIPSCLCHLTTDSVHLCLNGRKIILDTDIYLKRSPSCMSPLRIQILVNS